MNKPIQLPPLPEANNKEIIRQSKQMLKELEPFLDDPECAAKYREVKNVLRVVEKAFFEFQEACNHLDVWTSLTETNVMDANRVYSYSAIKYHCDLCEADIHGTYNKAAGEKRPTAKELSERI